MDEDQLLNHIAISTALEKLTPSERAMVLLVYKVEMPEDWEGRWPPRLEDIGHYIGLKYDDPPAPLSEAAIRYRMLAVEGNWQGRRGPLRRSRKPSDP